MVYKEDLSYIQRMKDKGWDQIFIDQNMKSRQNKRKKWHKLYYIKNKDKIDAQVKEWKLNHKEKIKKYDKNRYEKNKEVDTP